GWRARRTACSASTPPPDRRPCAHRAPRKTADDTDSHTNELAGSSLASDRLFSSWGMYDGCNTRRKLPTPNAQRAVESAGIFSHTSRGPRLGVRTCKSLAHPPARTAPSSHRRVDNGNGTKVLCGAAIKMPSYRHDFSRA